MTVGSMLMMGSMGSAGIYTGTVALAAIIITPIVAALYGFVLGVVFSFLYNIIAERIGGIELDVKK